MKAIAIHTVRVGVTIGKLSDDGKRIVVPATVDEHLPGTIFDIDDKRFGDLEKLGAVRTPTALELKIADTGGHVDPAELRAAASLNLKPATVTQLEPTEAELRAKAEAEKLAGKPAAGDQKFGAAKDDLLGA